jgi:hypothetical protein
MRLIVLTSVECIVLCVFFAIYRYRTRTIEKRELKIGDD